MKRFLCFWGLLAAALATDDAIFLENGKMVKTCAYVCASETWPESIFGQWVPTIYLTSSSHEDNVFDFSEKETLVARDQFEIYTLIMGAADLAKVNIGIDPYFEICDETALKAGYCKPETDEQKAAKVSLPELIDANDFSYPIESFMLDSASHHSYEIKDSGIYCVLFHSNSIPEKYNEENPYYVRITWQHSFGFVTLSEFHYILFSLGLTVAYGLYCLVYLGLTYRHIYDDKTSGFSIDSLKNMRFMFQYKTLSFLVGMFIVELFTSLNGIMWNAHGYLSTYFPVLVVMTLQVASELILSVWVTYNLMLFAAGAWVGSLEKSSKKVLTARIVSILYLIEMILQGIIGTYGHDLVDDEGYEKMANVTYVQLLVIIGICFFWSFHTIYNIENKQIRSLYIKTIFILGFVFCGPLLFMIFDYSPQLFYIASFTHFIATIVVSLLWKDVFFQNGLLCL